jgi:hypothetical protein
LHSPSSAATRLTIPVKQPETEHTVSVGKLQSWLDGGGKSPGDGAPNFRFENDWNRPSIERMLRVAGCLEHRIISLKSA